MMKFRWQICILGLVSVLAWAQEPRPGDPQFWTEGRLLVLKVVPGDKSAKFFFAGKKMANIDFKKDHKLLSITAINKDKVETLQFKDNGESYEVTKMPSWKGAYELNVKSEVRGSVEDLKIKLNLEKP